MYIGCIQSVKGSSARIFLNAITLRYTKCGEFTGQLSDYHLLSRDSISLSYSVHKKAVVFMEPYGIRMFASHVELMSYNDKY
jgi:hypothetical protein